jgi:integrase
MAKRRGQREGSIYRMKDGRWRAAISIGWKRNGNGEVAWRRRVITGKTRQIVHDQLTVALRDQQRGINIDPTRQTVGEFLATWLENTAKPSVRPKTYRSYEQMVRNHLAKTVPRDEWKKHGLDSVPGLKDVLLSKLTLQRVQQFLTDKLKAGNSPSLVRYLRVVLRLPLNEAVKSDLIPRNVAALATPPKVERREVVPFTPEQAGRFMKAALGHRLEALFTSNASRGSPIRRVQRPPMA